MLLFLPTFRQAEQYFAQQKNRVTEEPTVDTTIVDQATGRIEVAKFTAAELENVPMASGAEFEQIEIVVQQTEDEEKSADEAEDEMAEESLDSITSTERENLHLIGRKAAVRALGSPLEPEKYPCKNTKIGTFIFFLLINEMLTLINIM